MPVTANTFLNIVSNCTTFSDFHTWLCDLNNNLKGKYFERFCYYYFTFEYRIPVECFYLIHDAPASVLRAFDIPREDNGVDGLLKLQTGEWLTVQVKFKQDLTKATPYGDIQKWIGEANRFRSKGVTRNILFTNAMEISKKMRGQYGIIIIKHRDLMLIKPDFFTLVIESEKQREHPRKYFPPPKPLTYTEAENQELLKQQRIANLENFRYKSTV